MTQDQQPLDTQPCHKTKRCMVKFWRESSVSKLKPLRFFWSWQLCFKSSYTTGIWTKTCRLPYLASSESSDLVASASIGFFWPYDLRERSTKSYYHHTMLYIYIDILLLRIHFLLPNELPPTKVDGYFKLSILALWGSTQGPNSPYSSGAVCKGKGPMAFIATAYTSPQHTWQPDFGPFDCGFDFSKCTKKEKKSPSLTTKVLSNWNDITNPHQSVHKKPLKKL